MKKVIILRGLPGCGKSRYAEKLKKENGVCIVCSTDDYFMVDDLSQGIMRGEVPMVYRFDPTKLVEYHQRCLNFFLGSLRHGCSLIIVDNTNIHKWEYCNYEEAALLAGYEVEIVEFHATTIEQVMICARRNSHGVPADVIARHAINFEPDVRATVIQVEG